MMMVSVWLLLLKGSGSGSSFILGFDDAKEVKVESGTIFGGLLLGVLLT